jgi:hypothetical protein
MKATAMVPKNAATLAVKDGSRTADNVGEGIKPIAARPRLLGIAAFVGLEINQSSKGVHEMMMWTCQNASSS